MKYFKMTLGGSAVVFAGASALLYISVLFVPVEDSYLGKHLLYINPARICLLMSIFFFVWFTFVCKRMCDSIKIEKLFALFVIILYIGLSVTVVASLKGNSSRYGTWVNLAEENFNEVYEYLPYHTEFVAGKEGAYYEVAKMHDDCTSMVYVFDELPYSFEYEAEYITSSSPILNVKFLADRVTANIFNDFDPKISGIGSKGELDGVKYSFYYDNGDYAVTIAGLNYAYFTILKNGEELNIAKEMFIKTAVEQFKIMKESLTLREHEL